MTSKSLLIPVFLLFVIGLVMIFNASSADALDHNMSISATHVALVKQVCYGILGALLGWLLYTTGYRAVIEMSGYILIGLSILLLLVLIPGVGAVANGSRRWIRLGGFSIQPSEFVKFFLPLFYIKNIIKIKVGPTKEQFYRLLGVMAIPLLLILLEPNNGTVGVIVLSLLLLFFLTDIPLKLWALPVCISIVLLGCFAVSLPYVRNRIDIFLHPEKDLKGKGHQPHQAKIASGSGGVLGKGPGKSVQKLSYLPEAQNDYIAAIYAEEYGFLGVFVLISTYASLAIFGFSIAYRSLHSSVEQDGKFLVAATYTFLLSFQAFLNLAVVSGLLPSTGLNLPFFSQGGSSLIANLGAIGLISNIADQTEYLCRKRLS